MIIYISGPITGVDNAREPFDALQADLETMGHIVLNPSKHPRGLTNAQYMRMCFAEIDTADLVIFLPHWELSYGADLEHQYCQYTAKPLVRLKASEFVPLATHRDQQREMLRDKIKEVMK